MIILLRQQIDRIAITNNNHKHRMMLCANKSVTLAILTTFLLMLLSGAIIAQQQTDTKAFEKSFVRRLWVPAETSDSCISLITLLKVLFTKQSKIPGIVFSDSADSLLKKELNRIKSKLDYAELKGIAGNNSVTFIFPVIIKPAVDQYACFNKELTAFENFNKFSGKAISEKCFFRPEIEIITYHSVQ
ncbi:hypothetical protein GS399_03120 [Pedobacter sp. HMF7647]|uniref:Uncharacterized protein n=1 Tax=Hufsiella arboris TaxID=2695275 RepID=A0A7K1Y748_9SPHI|nr:hypothetical protein [Hufsiella arboris]MXV49949.1 hypothetical protein [Hufsiella arboris]